MTLGKVPKAARRWPNAYTTIAVVCSGTHYNIRQRQEFPTLRSAAVPTIRLPEITQTNVAGVNPHQPATSAPTNPSVLVAPRRDAHTRLDRAGLAHRQPK